MSLIYEVLVEAPTESMSEVAERVASAMGTQIAADQASPRQIELVYDLPLIVTSADYEDEGPALMVSRFNYSVFSWDLDAAERAFAAIAAATDWNIALFDEEQYRITDHREALPAFA